LLKDIKNILRQSAVYGFSRISAKLAGFILLPFISLKLDISSYGYIVLTESLWQILWAVFLFGLESGVIRWYTLISEDIRRKKFLFSVLLFVIVFNFICLLVLWAASSALTEYIYGNIDYRYLLIYAGIIASVEAVTFIIFLIIRIEEKVKLYTAFAVIITCLTLCMQLYSLYFMEDKLGGIFLAKILAPLAGVLMLTPYIIKKIKLGFDQENILQLIRYSFPIMLASLLGTFLNHQDRYILGKFSDSTSVGLYGLAYNISGIVNFLLISPFSLAFSVISWKKLKDENAERFFTKTVTYVFFTVIYFSLALALFIPHLIKLITFRTEYWAASEYLPIIILSTPFYAVQTIGVFSFYVTKNTRYILIIYLITVLVNFMLNIILIPLSGIYGVCISNVLAFFTLSLLTYIFSRNNYFFRYEWMKIFKMITCVIFIILPFHYIDIDSKPLLITLKLIALCMFPIFLYVFKFYEPIELTTLKNYLRKYLQYNH
jgi:O-antigen/teichoic acid export membrane protein